MYALGQARWKDGIGMNESEGISFLIAWPQQVTGWDLTLLEYI